MSSRIYYYSGMSGKKNLENVIHNTWLYPFESNNLKKKLSENLDDEEYKKLAEATIAEINSRINEWEHSL